MAGLLDFVKTPEGQGLLSAVAGGLAGARRGTPWNNTGRGLLAGVAGYGGAIDRQQQEAEAAQQNELRGMQIDAYRQNLLTAQEKANQDRRVKELIASQFGGPVTGINANAATGISGPRPEAATAIGQNPTPNYQALIAQGVPFDMVESLAKAPNLGRQKVARTAEIEGPGGAKRIAQLDEYGQEVGPAMNGYVPPVMVDAGDRKMFAKPIAGQSFAVNMSPSERAANARGWADIKTKQDANDINRTAARTQIVDGADGNVYLVDKGTGLSRPAGTMNGAPVRAGKAAEAAAGQAKSANDTMNLIAIAKDLLPGATGSGVGAAVDATGRLFGQTSESAQKAARLEALGGMLVMKMPRMEGPQSNMDQMLYREMAGKVGDRTIPVDERLAALKTVGDLQQKYTTGATQPPPAPAGVASGTAFQDPGKEQRYQEWKRRQGAGQ